MTFLKTPFVRRLAYVAGTCVLALASGHFVQHEASADAATAPVPVVATAVPTAPPEAPCFRDASVESGVADMLRVVLTAPCMPTGRVTLTQGPLAADWLFNGDEALHLSFTPLSHDEPLRITWPDGTETEHAVPTATSGIPFRVALVWDGPRILALNAREFGSENGSKGFIEAATTLIPDNRKHGFLTRLGDGIGQRAEVYTFPMGEVHTRGVVRISVTAPVTLATCGRTAKATALQADVFGGLTPSRVEIALPDCDAVGQTLVLRNLFRDLRLAAH